MDTGRITPNGLEPDRGSSERSSNRPLAFVVAGVLLGVIAATAFSADRGPTTESPPTSPSNQAAFTPGSSSTTTTTTTVPEASRLAVLVPGLLDTLVAVGISPDGTNVVSRWEPADTRPQTVSLPWGDIHTDFSHRWLSILSDRRYGSGKTLWVGNPAYAEPVAVDVEDSEWNATTPGDLAWIETTSEGVQLKTRTFLIGERTATRLHSTVPDDASIEWYTGSTIVYSTGEPRRLALAGEGSSAGLEGDLLAGSDRIALVETSDGVAIVDRELNVVGSFEGDLGGCSEGRFARPMVATMRTIGFVCRAEDDSVELAAWSIELDDGAPTRTTPLGRQPTFDAVSFTWASDRFMAVVAPISTARPESVLAVWEVGDTRDVVVPWSGRMYSVEALTP